MPAWNVILNGVIVKISPDFNMKGKVSTKWHVIQKKRGNWKETISLG